MSLAPVEPAIEPIISKKVRVIGQLVFLAVVLTACASTPRPEQAPGPTAAQVEQALDEGDLGFALNALHSLLADFPDDPQVLNLAARLYSLTEREGDLQAAVERILNVDPANPAALEQLGLIRLSAGELEQAENTLTLAVAMDPSRWMAWNGLGVVADLESRFDDAQNNFRRALEIVPGHPKVLANLGWSRLLADDLEAAEEHLRAALALAPDSQTTQSNLAFCVALKGRYEEAMALYQSLYDRSVAANNVGYAAMLRDDDSSARKYLLMALELKPNYYRKAANNLARISP